MTGETGLPPDPVDTRSAATLGGPERTSVAIRCVRAVRRAEGSNAPPPTPGGAPRAFLVESHFTNRHRNTVVPNPSPPHQTPMAAIIAESLTRIVRDADRMLAIVDQVSFAVSAGTSFSITGPSGSGKSTLLSLMAGLDAPSSGTIRVLGEDLAALGEEDRTRFRGRHIGFVFQSHQLMLQLTALENVMLPLEIQGKAGARRIASELLGEVGLADRLHHFPTTLSGGEQQRVGLARAYATQPRVLLADEPTGSLDAQTGERITALLFELQRNHGTTLVLVTHDEELAARCEAGIRLHAGKSLPRDPGAGSAQRMR